MTSACVVNTTSWNLWCFAYLFIIWSLVAHVTICVLWLVCPAIAIGTCGVAYLFIIWSFVVNVTICVFVACLSCNCQLELVALLTCSSSGLLW